MSLCPTCQTQNPDDAASCLACGQPLDPSRATVYGALPPGASLQGGKYVLDDVLGQGGFGITYRGRSVRLNLAVAIKEYFPSGASRLPSSNSVRLPQGQQAGLAEVMQEGQSVARYSDPGIVRVYEVFEENATAYLVMELLEGMPLSKRIESDPPLSFGEITDIGLQAGRALEVVHQAGTLHRDLKPDNIFLTQNGRVVLIDFGSARSFESGKTQSHTRTLTAGYAPLEQYSTRARYGPSTDIYALGATLYHALTRQIPPSALDRMQDVALPPLPAQTPAPLAKTVMAALEMKAEQRPQTVTQWLSLLQGEASRKPLPQPTPSRQRPLRWMPIIAGTVLVLGLGLAAFALLPRPAQPVQAAPPPTTPATITLPKPTTSPSSKPVTSAKPAKPTAKSTQSTPKPAARPSQTSTNRAKAVPKPTASPAKPATPPKPVAKSTSKPSAPTASRVATPTPAAKQKPVTPKPSVATQAPPPPEPPEPPPPVRSSSGPKVDAVTNSSQSSPAPVFEATPHRTPTRPKVDSVSTAQPSPAKPASSQTPDPIFEPTD